VLHERLSVFWGTPSTLGGLVPGGRFPPLDRLDLIESGLLLVGEDCRRIVARPGREELLVAGAEFALDFLGPGCGAAASGGLGSLTPAGEDVMAEIRRPEEMVAMGPRHLTKIVLFPVRFLFTAATGRMATNQAAVDHYVADGRSPSARLVTRRPVLADRRTGQRPRHRRASRAGTPPAVPALHRGPSGATGRPRTRLTLPGRSRGGPPAWTPDQTCVHRCRVPLTGGTVPDEDRVGVGGRRIGWPGVEGGGGDARRDGGGADGVWFAGGRSRARGDVDGLRRRRCADPRGTTAAATTPSATRGRWRRAGTWRSWWCAVGTGRSSRPTPAPMPATRGLADRSSPSAELPGQVVGSRHTRIEATRSPANA